MADLNFGCATFCALPPFGAVTTFSSDTTFSSHKVSVKGSDIDMCSAIYFFSIITRNIVQFIYVHTLYLPLCSYYVTGYYSPVAVKVKVGHTKKKGQQWLKNLVKGSSYRKKVLITTGKGLKIYPRQTLSRKR